MRTILITGAASGIGAATARLFHSRGWKVGMLDIDHQALATLSSELGGVWYAQLNVIDVGAVREALKSFCVQHDGHLHLLFNCAGVLRLGHFEEISLEEHTRILQINVLGLLQVTYAAFPYLKGTPGAQVINMGSASGLYGTPQMASYSASKFAVRGLTEALELEWRRHGIRVGDLMPPFVRTPMIEQQGFDAPILRRLGVNLSAEDIATAVWQQVERPKVHRPIHWLFRLIYAAGQLSPPFLSRLMMSLISRS
ncbi:hypothetical protein PS726_01212 [Pseudomonas fluorescens]|uniref:SDR family oxidoreductase n=1 Tax=Pseudomonas fluorescens TaxID=294 RepID=UPI00123F78D5|nr:SDR family oxidoreductase [Pseudomonas fluorescens]VVN82654.1 hypothetical protein PS726_01212 [Pseudomonas fluorescens]